MTRPPRSSFADAEVTKDDVKELFYIHAPGQTPEGSCGQPEIFGQHVLAPGNVAVHHTRQRGTDLFQGHTMPGACDKSRLSRAKKNLSMGRQARYQEINAGPPDGRCSPGSYEHEFVFKIAKLP
jgi:hypothetical protein